ncbi:MAG: VOC family protein [Bdellovibrionaceae bacterium]|nr:VOC family protein [Bdellovibrionales bacterium]MCB9085051.1 VOC family protein [Pseudobdellovibrionaceae bacterium]
MRIHRAHTILYVEDQERSRDFYSRVLMTKPVLDVPGMTEFLLGGPAVLGLMPNKGIKKLLGDVIVDPETGSGVPRAELYLVVEDPTIMFERAVKEGAKELSPFEMRDWGDRVAYVQDFDGHIIAFAQSKK